MKIEEMSLSVRARNALLRSGLRTSEQLMSMDAEDLLHIRNLGQKTLKEIQAVVKSLEKQEKEKQERIAPRGSYLHGYQEGSEAMRRAVIRELTRMSRHKSAEEQQLLTMACGVIKSIEVL